MGHKGLGKTNGISRTLATSKIKILRQLLTTLAVIYSCDEF